MKAETRCTPPITAQFGRNNDDTVWIAFGLAGQIPSPIAFPGTMQEARDVVRTINAHPQLVGALKTVLADVRDGDTDTGIAPATAERIHTALAAAGVRP